jgi:hypothetical protein
MKKAARVLFSSLLAIIITACTTSSQNLSISERSTAELKLERNQLIESIHLQTPYLSEDASLGYAMARSRRAARKSAIERELLRRYTAGDKEANLNIFDPQ